jgi:lysophospholipase L1-like esterase
LYVATSQSAWTSAYPTWSQSSDLVNLAVSGDTMLNISTTQVATIAGLIAAKPLAYLPVVILMAGTNDLAGYSVPAGGDPTGATLLTNFKAFVSGVRTQVNGRPFLLVPFTEIDRSTFFESGVTQSSYETEQATYNAGLAAATSFYTTLYDLAANATLGPPGAADVPPYTYFSDGTHPTVYAHANEIAPPLLTLLLSLL